MERQISAPLVDTGAKLTVTTLLRAASPGAVDPGVGLVGVGLQHPILGDGVLELHSRLLVTVVQLKHGSVSRHII